MNYDHVFIDIAMGGSNPRISKLTAIAAIRTDNKGNLLAAFAESLVSTVAARKVHTASVIERLKEEIVVQRSGFEPSYVVVAWNAPQDREALRHTIETDTDEKEELFKGRAWIDPMQLAWPLVYHDMIGDRTLESLCASFDITNHDPGTVEGECKTLVKVYWALMARYKTALVGEEVVRQVGGKPLETIRRIVGW